MDAAEEAAAEAHAERQPKPRQAPGYGVSGNGHQWQGNIHYFLGSFYGTKPEAVRGGEAAEL
jgi:hypothetical protein